MTYQPHRLTRSLIPRWAADAVLYVHGLLPGHGMYRHDRVRLFANFVLVAVQHLAAPQNAGPARAAAALRRLADLLENGEAHRLGDALDPDGEAGA